MKVSLENICRVSFLQIFQHTLKECGRPFDFSGMPEQSGIVDIDTLWAQTHLSYDQRLAFDGMLQNYSLDMTANFILMAYHLFGTRQRDASTIYLGVANRAAVILGLHLSGSDTDLSHEDEQQRCVTQKGSQ